MITRTIGTTGADHVDLSAWVSAMAANVTAGVQNDDFTAAVKAVGFSPTTSQVVSGWGPGGTGRTTTITADTAASWRDNASVQTNPFWFDSTKGAFIDGSSASSPTLNIQVDKVTVRNLQIRCSGSGYCRALTFESISSPTAAVLENCIIDGNTDVATATGCDNATARNNLILNRRGGGGSSALGFVNFTGTKAHANTVVNDTCGINFGSGGTGEAIGNVVTGLGGGTLSRPIDGRQTQVTGSHNATTNALWDSSFTPGFTPTNSQMSLTFATEFQGTADYRLKTGSVKCKDLGTTITGITTDAAGTNRTTNGGSAWDIGAWEFFVAGGGSVGSASGVGAASGIGASTAVSPGSASGIGVATGVGRSTAAAAASAAGVGAASGVGASTAAAVGASAGVATVLGVGSSVSAGQGVGSASGIATVSGVGASLAQAVGSASGVASVVGISPAVEAVSTGGGAWTGKSSGAQKRRKTKAERGEEWQQTLARIASVPPAEIPPPATVATEPPIAEPTVAETIEPLSPLEQADLLAMYGLLQEPQPLPPIQPVRTLQQKNQDAIIALLLA